MTSGAELWVSLVLREIRGVGHDILTNMIVTIVNTSIVLPCLVVSSDDLRAHIASETLASFCLRSKRWLIWKGVSHVRSMLCILG